ncbi:MAG: RNA helicase [Actinobacteria bacterium RBG_16_68_21]|nr:MAG: RNA helicase [Actinobacteria bacterium RBG_16_68_21]
MAAITPQVAGFKDLGVSDEIIGVLAPLGITEPFPIQTMTIPDGLAGRDVCGKAQTGSGKTLAFGIPLVERTSPGTRGRPRALILVPTRELCHQVAEELAPLAAVMGLGLAAVYGGASMKEQTAAVQGGAAILVATPGRLIDLEERKIVNLSDVARVVIDEADQMADMGFLPQVHKIMRAIGGGHQTMLFSATLDGQVASLISRYLTDPIRHEVETESDVVDTQDHRFLLIHHLDKPKVVAAITKSTDRALVFVSTKRGADRVAEQLQKEGVRAAPIHGDLHQSLREKTLADLISGDTPVLVATNLASRGLHIDDIDVVIHYDPPADYKSFIHRSGRTARAGESGLVVTLVEWDQVSEIERLQRASGLHQEIVKMFSNDPRLGDLAGFTPDRVVFKMGSDAELSRRVRTRRRRR